MALSFSTFSNAGGAVSDLFAGFAAPTNASLRADGMRIKARGDLAQNQQYDLAGDLAGKNVQFTDTSTRIQTMQQERANLLQTGGQKAAVAGAGFSDSGSAFDLLADSARQGALSKAVLGQQGLITEAGYEEQQKSFTLMSAAAKQASADEMKLADQTEEAGKQAQMGDFISGALKGVAAIASLALAPATGGASLALGLAATSAVGDPSGSGGLY